ncbi:MAG: hypothetical protein ACRD18_01405 [Terriglobia bacterium]
MCAWRCQILPNTLSSAGSNVANVTVNVRFERTTERRVAVNVLQVDGDLDVSVEPEQEEKAYGQVRNEA